MPVSIPILASYIYRERHKAEPWLQNQYSYYYFSSNYKYWLMLCAAHVLLHTLLVGYAEIICEQSVCARAEHFRIENTFTTNCARYSSAWFIVDRLALMPDGIPSKRYSKDYTRWCGDTTRFLMGALIKCDVQKKKSFCIYRAVI